MGHLPTGAELLQAGGMDNQLRIKRKPGFAGSFFPADEAAMNNFLDQAFAIAEKFVPKTDEPPLAIISPHAGFRFSGVMAARAFQRAKDHPYRRIVILSPSHRHGFSGIALPEEEAYATAVGDCDLDQPTCRSLVQAGHAIRQNAAHEQEHGIETQLPFIRRLFGEVPIVPLVVGDATDEAVSNLIAAIATGGSDGDSLFVISSDLSHFLTDAAAKEKDAETAALIELGKAAAISSAHACGWRPLRGFLHYSSNKGLRCTRLNMINSHTVGGDAERVVGYGAWSFEKAENARLSQDLRRECLRVARQSLAIFAAKNQRPAINLSSFHPVLQSHLASFVTLTQDNRLRGCIGSVTANQPLISDIAKNAVSAGYQDSRFKPLAPGELEKCRLKLAILSSPAPFPVTSEKDLCSKLTPGRDGLILQSGQNRGLFLPMVWESLSEPEQFVKALKVKAGLDKDFWSDDFRFFRFSAENFREA